VFVLRAVFLLVLEKFVVIMDVVAAAGHALMDKAVPLQALVPLLVARGPLGVQLVMVLAALARPAPLVLLLLVPLVLTLCVQLLLVLAPVSRALICQEQRMVVVHRDVLYLPMVTRTHYKAFTFQPQALLHQRFRTVGMSITSQGLG